MPRQNADIDQLLDESASLRPRSVIDDLEALTAEPSPDRPMVIYRGPLQRHRLRLVITALRQEYGDSDFVWLAPRRLRVRHIEWLAGLAGIGRLEVIDSRRGKFIHSARALRKLGWDPRPVTCFINASSLAFRAFVKTRWSIWFVQGIPEEKALKAGTSSSRLRSQGQWRLLSLQKAPDVTVVVSNPMQRLVADRLPKHNVRVVPNSVSEEFFREPRPSGTHTLLYLGTGAAWQNIEHLNEVWQHIHEKAPEIRFKVVSGDDKTLVLGRDIDPSLIERQSAWSAADVADLLEGSTAGFLLREDNLVNEVSCPVKFGEYLAASVPVIASDLGWDISDLLRESGAGLLLDPKWDAAAKADAVVAWLESPFLEQAIEQASPTALPRSDSAIAAKMQALLP